MQKTMSDTPLHQETASGNEEAVQRLIASGADVNAKNKNDNTPLHVAVASGNEAVAKLLIDLGATIDATNRYGETPLHWAAKAGNAAVAKLLIASGADIKAQTSFDGETPLHQAVYFGHPKCISKLLCLWKKVELTAQNERGETPLYLAISAMQQDNQAIIRLLLLCALAKHYSVTYNKTDKIDIAPYILLHRLIVGAQDAIIKYMIKNSLMVRYFLENKLFPELVRSLFSSREWMLMRQGLWHSVMLNLKCENYKLAQQYFIQNSLMVRPLMQDIIGRIHEIQSRDKTIEIASICEWLLLEPSDRIAVIRLLGRWQLGKSKEMPIELVKIVLGHYYSGLISSSLFPIASSYYKKAVDGSQSDSTMANSQSAPVNTFRL